MLISDTDLTTVFSKWRAASDRRHPPLATPHLDEESLLRLAGKEGLAAAASGEIEHLDSCPDCFAAWAAWRRALSAAAGEKKEEMTERDDNRLVECAFGFQEAAASQPGATAGPQVFTSSCGGWRLEWLPQRDQPGEGLLLLTARNPLPAGVEVSVCDHQGRKLLSGPLEEGGRLARRCRDFSQYDLSLWTVVTSRN